MSVKRKILGQGMTSLRTRKRLIERLTDKGIKDVRVLQAIRDTPRHLFLDEALSSRAYEDMALPIGFHQTISQPYVVARMTEVLIRSKKLKRKPIIDALEIGTGCGYQTAVLAKLSENVLSIERVKPLQEKAKNILKELNINNISLMHDDGNEIRKMEKKFDAILSAAAPQEVPNYLVEKLKVGGRLILPLGSSTQQQLTLITRKDDDNFEKKVLDEVLFVPFLRGLID